MDARSRNSGLTFFVFVAKKTFNKLLVPLLNFFQLLFVKLLR